jgi:hypothetical protein
MKKEQVSRKESFLWIIVFIVAIIIGIANGLAQNKKSAEENEIRRLTLEQLKKNK